MINQEDRRKLKGITYEAGITWSLDGNQYKSSKPSKPTKKEAHMTVEDCREQIKLCEQGKKLVKASNATKFNKANDIFYFTLSINQWKERIIALTGKS